MSDKSPNQKEAADTKAKQPEAELPTGTSDTDLSGPFLISDGGQVTGDDTDVTDEALDELVAFFSKPRTPFLLPHFSSTSSNIGPGQQADAKEDDACDDGWDNIGEQLSRESTGTPQKIRIIGLSSRSNAPSTSPSPFDSSSRSFFTWTTDTQPEGKENKPTTSILGFLNSLHPLDQQGETVMSDKKQEQKIFVSFGVSERLKQILASYVDMAQKDTLDALIDGFENEINATSKPEEITTYMALGTAAYETGNITDYLEKMNNLVSSTYAQATLRDISNAINQIGGAGNSQIDLFRVMDSPTPPTSPLSRGLSFSFSSTSQLQDDAKEAKLHEAEGEQAIAKKSQLYRWQPQQPRILDDSLSGEPSGSQVAEEKEKAKSPTAVLSHSVTFKSQVAGKEHALANPSLKQPPEEESTPAGTPENPVTSHG